MQIGSALEEKNIHLLSQMLENIYFLKIVTLVQRNPCIDGEVGKLLREDTVSHKIPIEYICRKLPGWVVGCFVQQELYYKTVSSCLNVRGDD